MKGIYLHVLTTRTAKHPASRYRFVSKNYKKKQDQGDQFYSWILFGLNTQKTIKTKYFGHALKFLELNTKKTLKTIRTDKTWYPWLIQPRNSKHPKNY